MPKKKGKKPETPPAMSKSGTEEKLTTETAAGGQAGATPQVSTARVVAPADRSLIPAQSPLLTPQALNDLRGRLKAKYH